MTLTENNYQDMVDNTQNRSSETSQSIIESAKNYTSEISDKVRNAT